MTAAAIYSQYRRPPPKRDPDARDGHITEFDRKMAARGEDMRLWVAKKYGLEDARGADGAASTAPRRGLDLTRAGPRAAR